MYFNKQLKFHLTNNYGSCNKNEHFAIHRCEKGPNMCPKTNFERPERGDLAFPCEPSLQDGWGGYARKNVFFLQRPL